MTKTASPAAIPLCFLALALHPAGVFSQEGAADPDARDATDEPGVALTIGGVGIGIGDVPRLNGLRLNFRDREMRHVNGINATIWTPYEPARGTVHGLALGVPVTGARRIAGVGLGIGVGADRAFDGVALAPVGVGAGGTMRGVFVGGLGVGTGGRARGILAGGLGVGAGGSLDGIAVGGLGVAAGGSIRGLTLAGLGAGAGGDMTGVNIAGIGLGVGGEAKWVNLAGVGVGASRVTGVGVGVGAERITGLTVAPFYLRVTPGGEMRGVSVSAFNRIDGTQSGLAIGILNIAEELDGLQIGLINIARNKPSRRVLPFFNYYREP